MRHAFIVTTQPAFENIFYVCVTYFSCVKKPLICLEFSPFAGNTLWVNLAKHTPCLRKTISVLQMTIKTGELYNSRLAFVDYEAELSRNFTQNVKQLSQCVPALCDCIKVVRVSAVTFDTRNYLREIIEPVGIYETDALRVLVTNIHALIEEFLARKSRGVGIQIQHCVYFALTHCLYLFIGEAAYIYPECLEHFGQQSQRGL